MICPICRKATVAAYRPFCSRRCADIDLRRWLTEGYAVPASDEEAATTLADSTAPVAGQGRQDH